MPASAAAFAALLESASAVRVFLLEVAGYVDELAGDKTFYFASQAFTTRPSDTPANQIFEPRLEADAVFTSRRSLFDGGAIGGRSVPGRAEIAVINLDGDLDAFARHGFDGRTLTVKLGAETWIYGDFVTVLSGTVEAVEVTNERVTFLCRDLQDLLDKPVQSNLFAGTGGAEGGGDLKGKPKPRSYGVVRNGEPVFLGFIGACMAWQINDGAVAAYDSSLHRLYDRGSPLTYEAANPPSSGKWTLDATNGILLFNGSVTGPVTADWKGDATGSGYVSTVADIARRLVTGPGGLADPAGLDTASFAALNTAQPGVIGLYLREGGNLLEVLDQLVEGLACFWGFTRGGLFQVAQFAAPAGPPVLTLTENEVLELAREAVELPAWRQTLGYQKCWRLQDDGELTGAYANSVTDGGFAAGTGWTNGTGWTFSGSVANAAAGSASDLSQPQTLVIGQVYRLTFDLTRSAGTLQPKIGGGNLGSALNATGSYVLEFTATATSMTLAFSKDSAFAGTLDNVVLRSARVDFVANEYRTVTAPDAAVQTKHLRARDERVDCLLDSAADAATEVARRLALFKVDRAPFRARAKATPFAIDLHAVVRLSDSRFELDAGKDFRVVDLAEVAGRNEIELLLWG